MRLCAERIEGGKPEMGAGGACPEQAPCLVMNDAGGQEVGIDAIELHLAVAQSAQCACEKCLIDPCGEKPFRMWLSGFDRYECIILHIRAKGGVSFCLVESDEGEEEQKQPPPGGDRRRLAYL